MECFQCKSSINELTSPLINICNCKSNSTYIHKECTYDSITIETCKICNSKYHLNNFYSLFDDEEVREFDDLDLNNSDELIEYSEDFITDNETSDISLPDSTSELIDQIKHDNNIECKNESKKIICNYEIQLRIIMHLI